KRLPNRNNVYLKKIVSGIVENATEQEVEQMGKLCYAPQHSDRNIIEQHLLRWLYNEDEREIINEHKQIQGFGEKLNRLMEMFHISNIKLSRGINIDASLVSRYRSGVRVPTTANWVVDEMAKFFVTECEELEQKSKLVRMTGCKLDVNEVDNSLLEKLVTAWLRSSEYQYEQLRIERLFKTLDNYKPTTGLPEEAIQIFETVPDVGVGTQAYIGIIGFRQLLLRALITLLRDSKVHTCYVFSNQSLEWFFSDEKFHDICISLLKLLVKKGSRIKIIHNLNRPVEELHEAVLRWGGLQISGAIDSYYLEELSTGAFSHTSFVVPNKLCIQADFVSGTEQEARYLVFTEPYLVSYYYDQFQVLFQRSKKLIQIGRPENFKELGRIMYDYGRRKGDTIVALPVLSLGTMPEEVFTEMIERYPFTKQKKVELCEYYHEKVCLYKYLLETQCMTEYLAFDTPKEIQEGKVSFNLPAHLCEESVVYTMKDYASHVRNLMTILKTHKNYKMIPLKTKKFDNIEIVVKNNNSVLVVKLNGEVITLLYEHEAMSRVCNNFLESLELPVPMDTYDMKVVMKELEHYL
ncbi:MAG: hypothetical protein RR791_06725, partial [Lachnospiraceae bacterium]